MMKNRWIGSVALLALVGCGGSKTADLTADLGASLPDASMGSNSSGTDNDGGAASTNKPGGCTVDSDCASLLGGVTPIPSGCAEAYCNKATTACGLRAFDKDGDGFRAAQCEVPGFLAFEKGGDCDDGDPNFYPGKSRDCGTNGDGKIAYPGGTPRGECKYGAETCESNGIAGACKGAVGPAVSPNCSSDKDATCDGKPDWQNCGECKLGEQVSCYDGPAGTAGVGECKASAKSCIANAGDPSKTNWGACAGQVVPKDKNPCDEKTDAMCKGDAQLGCKCVSGETKTCGDVFGAKGACVKGSVTCVGGQWTACPISAKSKDTCDPENDDDCNGVANSGVNCKCNNGESGSCGEKLGLKGPCAEGNTSCVNGSWTTCSVPAQPTDTCDPQNDASCDGVANNGALPNASCSCINGPFTCNQGQCNASTVTCAAGRHPDCPAPATFNGISLGASCSIGMGGCQNVGTVVCGATAGTATCSVGARGASGAAKDNCCPAGANNNTDADCAVVCGNGVKEAGEACDTTISSGADACPTASSCTTSDVCKDAVFSGTNCTASCQITSKGASTHTWDNCCPAGANGKTDADCAVLPVGCGPTDRYQVTGTGAWDNTVYDRTTGNTWKRGTEQNSTLGACNTNPHDAAYCCSTAGTVHCNWQGAKDYCTSHGQRLPSKEELEAIASPHFAACAFNSWYSWSATPAASGSAWYASADGRTFTYDVRSNSRSLYSNYVRCVR